MSASAWGWRPQEFTCIQSKKGHYKFAYKCGLKMFLKWSKESCSVCLSAFERLVVCLVVCEYWRWVKVQVCSNLTWNVNKTRLTVTPNILYVFIWTVTHSNLIIAFYLKILCNKHTNHSIEGKFFKALHILLSFSLVSCCYSQIAGNQATLSTSHLPASICFGLNKIYNETERH